MATRTRGVLPVSFARSLTPNAAAAWRRAGWLPPIGGAQDPAPDPAEGKPDGAPAPAGGGGNVEIPDGANNPDAVQKAIREERAARAAAEQRAKDAEAKLAKQEEDGKTEAEKTAERLAALEAANAEAERRATLAETSQATSVPSDILAGPKSTSPEHLAEFAELVNQHAKDSTKTPPATGGSNGGARPRPATPDLQQQIDKAAADGDWALHSQLNAQLLQQARPN